MKVSDLIDELKGYPQDATVKHAKITIETERMNSTLDYSALREKRAARHQSEMEMEPR